MAWRLFLSIVLMMSTAPAESIPPIRAQSFSGVPVELPADLHGRVGILVIGFSKNSSVQTRQWNEVLLPDFGNDARVAYYQGAVLADVPALIRGVVINGIRRPMSPAERAHFIPILDNARRWRDAAKVGSGDEAYILVVDPAGEIKWQTHGGLTRETYTRMKDCMTKLQGAGNAVCTN